ncbi:hypothetical protein KJ742_01695 [Patescibacteria group bacterium]|nr:hypothetical protein [Patescibacteria group bacterium]
MIGLFSKVAYPIITSIYFITTLFGGISFVHAEETETTYYFLNDHLGNMDVVLDDEGNVVERVDYLPYGDDRLRITETGAPDTDYGFTGKEKDKETDLYYYGARYYDSEIGRFATVDPLVLDEAMETEQDLKSILHNPQSLNAYTYALNNPVKYVDESGEWAETAIDVIFFALSTRDFYMNPGVATGLWMGADAIGTILPIPAIAGYIRHGAKATKILNYFSKVASDSNKSILKITKTFSENILFKQTRRTWSVGEANDKTASLVGHFEKHEELLGAKNLDDYYNKANDFIDSAEFSWKEGADQVFFNSKTKEAAYLNQQGEIRSFYKVVKENKLNGYMEKVKEIEDAKK